MDIWLYALIIFLILIRPYSFCKYFNNTCYQLFSSSDSVTLNNTSKNVTAVSNMVLDRNSETEGCIESGYEKICSEHGQCVNSTCQCDHLEPLKNRSESLYEYTGKFCEECPYCKGQRCEKFYPCLECILQNSTCRNNNCYFFYNLVEKVEKYDYKDKMCVMEENNGCLTNFKYLYDKNNDLLLSIEMYKRCLNGRNYLLFCCYAFLVYVIVLMVLSKKLLNGVYYIPET